MKVGRLLVEVGVGVAHLRDAHILCLILNDDFLKEILFFGWTLLGRLNAGLL